jgi:hypothetical protein
MRSVVLTATLISTLWLALPAGASAQEPEAAPAPTPVARERAVPRGANVVARDAEARRPETGRETSNARQAERRRPPVSSATTGSATTASADEQRSSGGQRRGAVRRPPSGGSDSERSRDRAVPRENAPRRNDPIYVYRDYRRYNRYYDPWGYGAFGLGYFYYSPWAWNPGYYGYGYGSGYGGSYVPYGYDLGRVKLKVKPRDAEVFVDNYFAGYVDDFDGFFQALKLDSGGYRIEIRKPGFEPLHFDVRVQPDRTITFRGEMKPLP